eukprot:jgi/Chlat1/3657/Chrsp238S03650
MALKLLALGPRTYVANRWHILDTIVVITGWLVIAFTAVRRNSTSSAIRIFRILRTLRALTAFPGIKLMVHNAILAAKEVLHVFVLAFFVFVIFGVVGVQLCTRVNLTVWGGYTCPTGPVDSSNETVSCVRGFDNPNFGITNFDNLLSAFLVIFQLVTLSGWTDLMYKAQDATVGWAAIYFVIVVFFGAFVVLNLVTAVMTELLEQKRLLAADAASRASQAGRLFEWEFPRLRDYFRTIKTFLYGPHTSDHKHAGPQLLRVNSLVDMGSSLYRRFQRRAEPYVISPRAETVVTVVIGINTLVLAVAWNLFDAIVVASSALQFINFGRSFTALRVFRILRILKVVR